MADELEQDLLRILKDRFSFENFRRGQLDILKSILSGRDTLAVMPTGKGKSLCYQVPALYRNGIVLVVSPLISLMQDQVRNLQTLGLPAGCLHSGQAVSEKKKIFERLKSESNFLLYLSPERIQKEGFSAWLPTQNISLFAIDESHCISKWGHDFREDYGRLKLLRDLKPTVPVLALTATATPQVLFDITRQLGLKNPDRHVYGFYRPNLFYQVESCDDDDRKEDFLRQALHQFPEGRILVYCGTRKQCEELSVLFSEEFSDSSYYHAGMSPEMRSSVQKSYDSGEIRILFATNAFGMGIDHPNVRLVLHYQMPANIESYYQEVGRAGRDGAPSTCLLLYSKRDRGLQSFFIRDSSSPPEVKSSRWRALDAIIQYAEGGECRHSGILTYFRDTQRIRACGHCDICAPSSARNIARPTRSFVEKMKRLKQPAKSSKKEVDLEAPLTKEQELRYDLLKAWRKRYADENDLPAFMIFSNKSLRDLSVRNPRTLDQLERCYGFGPQKRESIGQLILNELGVVQLAGAAGATGELIPRL